MLHEGEERRRYPRSRRGFPAITDHSGPGVLNHIDNISGNGILCHTIRPIPMMTKMSIVIEVPHPAGRRIECEGIVVRCDSDAQGDDRFKVAILFSKISDGDHQAVVDFVEHDLLHVEAVE